MMMLARLIIVSVALVLHRISSQDAPTCQRLEEAAMLQVQAATVANQGVLLTATTITTTCAVFNGWTMGEQGQSCSAACGARCGICNATASSHLSEAGIVAVVRNLGATCSQILPAARSDSNAPYYYPYPGFPFCGLNPYPISDCGSTPVDPYIRRVCFCGDPSLTCPVFTGWTMGEQGQSCVAACGARCGICNARATAPLNTTDIVAVVTELGGACSLVVDSVSSRSPYYDTRESASTSGPVCYASSRSSADCESIEGLYQRPDSRRLCFCGFPSPVTTTTATTTTTTTTPEFSGWTMGEPGQECYLACKARGGICNGSATAPLNTTEIFAVVTELGGTCSFAYTSTSIVAPFYNSHEIGDGRALCYASEARNRSWENCYVNSFQQPEDQRLCFCGDPSFVTATTTTCPVFNGWTMGEQGQSCVAACGARCGTCNASATARLSTTDIVTVVSGLGGACSRVFDAVNSHSPYYDTRDTAPPGSEPVCYTSSRSSADCGSTELLDKLPDVRRLCFCGDPSLVTTTTTTTLFTGWTRGEQGQSCAAACGARGGICNASATVRMSTTDTISAVVTELGETCSLFQNLDDTYPCPVYVTNWGSTNWPAGTTACCAVASVRADYCRSIEYLHHSGVHRLCFCGDPSLVTTATTTNTCSPVFNGWTMGEQGQSCEAACRARCGICNASATAPLNTADIVSVVTELGGTCSFVVDDASPLSPFYDTRESASTTQPFCYASSRPSADCGYTQYLRPDRRRLCFCGDPSLLTTTITSSTFTMPTTTTTTCAVLNGWVMAYRGQSCTSACEDFCGICNAGATGTLSANNTAYIAAVVTQLGGTCRFIRTSYAADGLPYYDEGWCYVPADASGRAGCSFEFDTWDKNNKRRLCFCGDPSLVPKPTTTIGVPVSKFNGWTMGEQGQSCVTACEARGGSCNPSATAALSKTDIVGVVTELGGICSFAIDDVIPFSPFYDTRDTADGRPVCHVSSSSSADCGSTEGLDNWPDARRLCGCGVPSLVTATTTTTTSSVQEPTTLAAAIGDPHIDSLDGRHYMLLQQGTFSLWHFTGLDAKIIANNFHKPSPVDFSIYAHYSGRASYIKGLLVLDKSGGKGTKVALEMTSQDCRWHSKTSDGWYAVNGSQLLSLPDTAGDGMTAFNVVEKSGKTNLELLIEEVTGSYKHVGNLFVRCKPGHFMNIKMSMRTKDVPLVEGQLGPHDGGALEVGNRDYQFKTSKTWADLGGSSVAASYLKSVDEQGSMLVQTVCSKDEEQTAKALCSKYLGEASLGSKFANAFANCVYDVCHGGGEVAAQLAAEIWNAE